jgi:hypothetical protein
MNHKKKSRRCWASASIQALDLAISRFIYSFEYRAVHNRNIFLNILEHGTYGDTAPAQDF